MSTCKYCGNGDNHHSLCPGKVIGELDAQLSSLQEENEKCRRLFAEERDKLVSALAKNATERNNFYAELQAIALKAAVLTEENERLKELSVARILLKVVPGDGDGEEVYAKSVDDVERELSDLCDRLENYELGIWVPEYAKLRITGLEVECERLKEQVVYGFYHGEIPQFQQGGNSHEVLEVVTAKDCENWIASIKTLDADNERLQAEVEHYKKQSADRLIGLCKCGIERDALLAEKKEREEQKPVAWCYGVSEGDMYGVTLFKDDPALEPLYAHPVAKKEEV